MAKKIVGLTPKKINGNLAQQHSHKERPEREEGKKKKD